MATFKDLQEVQLFEWSWQHALTSWMLSHVQAARIVTTRAFTSAGKLIGDFLNLMRPWTDQVLRTVTQSWNLVLRKLPEPILSAFKKLDDLRTDVWDAGLEITEKIAYAGEKVIDAVTTPLAWSVDRIRLALRSLGDIAQAIALKTELAIFNTEVRTHDATGAVAAQIDELSSWLDHILDEDGLFQPRILLGSAGVYMGGLLALLVNGGITGNPKQDFLDLLEQHPFPDGSTILPELAAGKMAPEENITAALETFDGFFA